MSRIPCASIILLEPDPRGSMGLGGTGGGGGASYGTFLDAIDYKTGKVEVAARAVQWERGTDVNRWRCAFHVQWRRHRGDPVRRTGKPLWHSEIGALSSPPETFLLDGKQRVLATGATGLYMFVLN